MKILKKKFYIYFLTLFFLVIFLKFFEHTYILLKYDYETRLTKNYGFCEKSSYGFIKYIQEKYELKKNIKIINDESHPSSEMFIHKPKRQYYTKHIILLNYNDQNSKINLSKYNVIDKFKNCYYLEKK